MSKQNDTRRDFIKQTAVAGAAVTVPYYFSTSNALANETRSKNDRMPIGLIGAGGMGVGNMVAAKDWVDVVAISDADSDRMDHTNRKLSGGKADTGTRNHSSKQCWPEKMFIAKNRWRWRSTKASWSVKSKRKPDGSFKSARNSEVRSTCSPKRSRWYKTDGLEH